MLSRMDDYPLHQIADVIRHVGTSDRNFYDRYYFNLHGSSDDLFMVMGMGQYPNLGVQDAFACARRGDRITSCAPRASSATAWTRASGRSASRCSKGCGACASSSSRASTRSPSTSPGRARSRRSRAAAVHPQVRARALRHHALRADRLLDRHAHVGDETFRVTPDRWWGTRDRSWGVRPVGEPEHPGIRRPKAR